MSTPGPVGCGLGQGLYQHGSSCENIKVAVRRQKKSWTGAWVDHTIDAPDGDDKCPVEVQVTWHESLGETHI